MHEEKFCAGVRLILAIPTAELEVSVYLNKDFNNPIKGKVISTGHENQAIKIEYIDHLIGNGSDIQLTVMPWGFYDRTTKHGIVLRFQTWQTTFKSTVKSDDQFAYVENTVTVCFDTKYAEHFITV